MIWVVVVGFAIVALIDLPPLLQQKKWRAVTAFVCVFAVGLTLEVLTVLKIQVPSALEVLGKLVQRLGLSYPA